MSDYLALTDEVVVEMILWRLPVKSILECRCVCKSWYSLITNPNFIHKHLIRKTLNPQNNNPQIFIYRNDCHVKSRNCLLFFDKQDYFHSLSLQIPHDLPNPYIQTVGSVNGLICLTIGDNGITCVVSLIIFNPLIGHFLSIPSPPSRVDFYWNVRGFGYNERTLDYKILLIFYNRDGYIYSLNSNCWTQIICPDNWCMNCNDVVFVNRKFHWFVRDFVLRYRYIMVLDVEGQVFGSISLPECLANSRCQISFLVEFGESSIAVGHPTNSSNEGYVTHIWIMKEYGSVESWIKLTLGNSELTVLGLRNKDEVLIRCKNGSIASQKIKNNNKKLEAEEDVKNIMDLDPGSPEQFSFKVHSYVPSLVLLDKQYDVDVAAPIHQKLTMKTVPTHTNQIKYTRAKRIKTLYGTSIAAGIKSAKVEGHRIRRPPVWQHDFIMS